jgi:type I restriction enzyme S subunit
MQQLLTGRKRLPGFAPAKPTYKQTELGKIPTDGEFVPVSELAKDMADGPFGSNLKKEHYTSDPQARIIQLSNIGENGWEDENTKYTTFEHAKTIARCIVPKEESILVAKMMPAGRAIICPKIEKQYVLGSDVIRITANEKLNSKYFVYASKSDVYLKQISDNTQGSTRQRTSISKLRKILILLPSLDEQTAIANVLSDMDTEIATLETKLAKYRKLKTGMMQQLLTGKIRLV